MPSLKLEPKEIACLMRALLRSLEKTPYSEEGMHKALYEKLADLHVSALPKKFTGQIGRAIDLLIGR